jgi:hypothetical protein
LGFFFGAEVLCGLSATGLQVLDLIASSSFYIDFVNAHGDVFLLGGCL